MRKSVYILLAGISISGGCRHDQSADILSDSDFVAQYRDSVLLMSDILMQIPSDISESDSDALIRKIADQWIQGFLIEDLAATQIDDMDRIDKMTEAYRRSLIVDSYRRKMRQKGVQPIDKEAVDKYYRQHSANLLLERPILKGLFIRVPAKSRYLDDIRNWMQNPGPDTYDALENTGRREATGFRYFADQWTDFDLVASEFPKRITDADKFLETTTDIETELNGTVYILHISDFKKTGDRMPKEYAGPIIEDRLKSLNLADYETALVKSLRKSAIGKDILKEGSYLKQNR